MLTRDMCSQQSGHTSTSSPSSFERKLKVEKKAESMAVHHPCKVIHNDETALLDELLEVSGARPTPRARAQHSVMLWRWRRRLPLGLASQGQPQPLG